MARRARFGQYPRAQPSLTATLVAIAREMVAQQDRNLMDAWKNGGLFEGQEATDQRVLAYWNERMKNLDPNDPLYDTYKDQILQLHYGIEQSEMDLKHVQGKITDAQYAQFFIGWAKKAPRNSEWWRTLQKDAAQLLESAKAKAHASAEKARQDSFNAFVKDQEKDIGIGNALTDAIQKLSNDTGLSVTDHGDQLLNLLTQDYAAHPDKYHALADVLKAGAPNFDGAFTHAFVAQQIDNAESAFDHIATRANKDGYASAYATATKGQSDLSGWATNLKVWPVAKSYDQAYNQFSKVWNDPNASAMDKQAAAAKFSATATTLSQAPGIDTASITMLQADAARALGQDAGDSPSFGAFMLGHQGFTAEMQAQVAVTAAAQLAKDQNQGAFVYASVDKNGNFDPTGQGAVGIVSSLAVPSDVVFIAQPGLGGQAVMVAVQPHSIIVDDPNDPNAAPTSIGRVISYQVGGRQITMYGYQDAKGEAHWSLTSPQADGVTAVFNKKDGNLHLTLPGTGDVAAQAAAIDKQYGTDIRSQVASLTAGGTATSTTYVRGGGVGGGQRGAAAEGKLAGKIEVTFDGTKFSVKQTGYTYDAEGKQVEGGTITLPIAVNTPQQLQQAATAPSRWTGGRIDGVTYASPVAASVAATTQQMSSGQVSALAQNPDFQHAFVQQTMQTLGTKNPLDPRVIDAWNTVTAAASPAAQSAANINTPTSRERRDLTYPGTAPSEDPTKTALSVTFNNQTLRVPGLPAYLANAQGQGPSVNLNGVSDLLKAGGSFLDSVLYPGQLVGGPKPPGATLPPIQTRAADFTVTPTAPTPAPKPTTTSITPTTGLPTPAPAPAPRNKPRVV